MASVRNIINRFNGAKLSRRLGHARVRLQSRLFSPAKGTFPPAAWAVRSAFPPVWKTDDRPHGLVAVGGAITEETLLAAYARGIHPFCDREPIQWVVFNPRMVLFPARAKVGKGVRPLLRSNRFSVTFDTAFEEVVQHCSNRDYTWLVPERIQVAVALHRKGQAHSVEVWNRDGRLVGGLFGVDMGRIYIGESAFSDEPNAMKVGFAYLNCHLQHWGFELHDAQMHGRHLALMGFEEIPYKEYAGWLRKLAGPDIRRGPWHVDPQLDVAAWQPAVPGSRVKASARHSQAGAADNSGVDADAII